MAKSKLAKYKSRRRNPRKKEIVELATSIGAGFAGYGAARLVGRMVFSQAVRRWPGASKPLYVAASALAATGVYFGTKHWDRLDEYHEAATVGAGIALLQSAIQTFMPKFGWVVSDVDASQYAARKKAVLPDADMSMLDAPESSAGDDFNLDALLAEHPEIEAVPIAKMAPAPHHLPPSDDDSDMSMGNATGFGNLGDDIENYNGFLN